MPSPTRQRAEGVVTIDVETLKGLLAEQSATLLERVMEGQRGQLSSMASDLRKEMKEGEAAIKAEVQSQNKVMGTIQDSHKELLQRIRKLENGTSSGVSTAEPINVEATNLP